MIDRFERHQVILNKSSNTIKAYKLDISQFLDFISSMESKYSKIKKIHIRHFLSYLSGRGLSTKSISRKLSSLKLFFAFLVEIKKIKSNPTVMIMPPKITKSLPSIIDCGEFERMIDHIDTKQFKGKRDLAMLEFLYSSGVRAMELLDLDEDALDLRERTAVVKGKGSKERMVFFSEKTRAALVDYIPLKKHKFPGIKELFVNNSGRRLSTRSLRNIVTQYTNKAGIEKDVSPHTFRHSFASFLLDKGIDLKLIQEFLGHSSISSTQIYTHISKEELRKSYDKFGPFS